MKRLSLASLLLCQSIGGMASAASFPLEIDNQSGIASDAEVYLSIKASIDDHDCMMKIESSGEARCEFVNKDSDLSQYSYTLNSIPKVINLPHSESGRIYFSLAYPLRLHVDTKSEKIVDPDGFNPRDTNYYTFYDKVEYSFNDAGTWMNPTAVDFFSLPLRISQSGSTSSVTAAGFSDDRDNVLQKVDDVFDDKDVTQDKVWQRLKLRFDDNLLRLMAPGKAMVDIPNTLPFPLKYLADFDGSGFNYTDYLWDYYRDAGLSVDVSELRSKMALSSYLFTGHVVGDDFVFSNEDGSFQVSIAKPVNSRPFFAGAGDSFDAENNTPKAVIIREFTSAFEAGLLPAENGTVLNKDFFAHAKPNYYSKNALVPDDGGPWYDLYSKALHGLGESQAIYTFAYDDALGQDGTLHDPNGETPSKATIVLGNMGKSSIPNPYLDATVYTIMPVLGADSVVMYDGKPLHSNQAISGVGMPFHVTLNGVPMDIYIDPQMVLPFSSQSDGVVIDKTAASTATIIFPSKPKL